MKIKKNVSDINISGCDLLALVDVTTNIQMASRDLKTED